MTATFLLNLALGGITVLTQTIMALTGWVNGSMIVSGNFFWDNTNNTNTEYVGAQQLVQHKAGGYNFLTNGTQSGVVLQDAGVTSVASRIVSCVGTGGLLATSYDTCLIPPLLTTSGTIVRLTLMTSYQPVSTPIDCGFVKSRRSATGSTFTNFNSVSGTGGSLTAFFGTGAIRWNGADFIKCGTIATPTASYSAKLRVDYFDDTSE